MLTLEQFKAVLESYGAKPHRWPEAVRADAEALLGVSAAARRLSAEAQELDDAILAAGRSEDARLGSPDEQAAALARLRERVAARIASPARRAPVRWWFGLVPPTLRGAPSRLHRAAYPRLGWVALAAAGFVVAAGLALGSLYGSAPPTDHVLALLQPEPLSIFADQ